MARPIDPAVQADPRHFISLTVPVSLLALIERFAANHDLSRAQACRILLEVGLETRGYTPRRHLGNNH